MFLENREFSGRLVCTLPVKIHTMPRLFPDNISYNAAISACEKCRWEWETGDARLPKSIAQ